MSQTYYTLPFLPLQVALVGALSAAGLGVPVYAAGRVPQGVTWPYVTVQVISIPNYILTTCAAHPEVRAAVAVHSRASTGTGDDAEAFTLAEAAARALPANGLRFDGYALTQLRVDQPVSLHTPSGGFMHHDVTVPAVCTLSPLPAALLTQSGATLTTQDGGRLLI